MRCQGLATMSGGTAFDRSDKLSVRLARAPSRVLISVALISILSYRRIEFPLNLYHHSLIKTSARYLLIRILERLALMKS